MTPRRVPFLLILLPLLTPCGAEETVRLQDGGRLSGTVSSSRDEVRVSWPYGSVSVPARQVEAAPTERPLQPPRSKAWTRGVFTLRYELVRDGDAVRARRVSVGVKNTLGFLDEPTERLREHERMHRLINA